MPDAIDKAVEIAKLEFQKNPASVVHRVSRGLLEMGDDNQEGIVITVGDKVQAYASDQPAIPRCYSIDGQDVYVEVREAPVAKIARMMLGEFTAQAANDLQRCHQCPIPGGAQIAPEGAPWVGTLGAAITFDGGTATDGQQWGRLWGCLTNYHVAVGGRFKPGTKMLQPGPGSAWFARLHTWSPINFRGGTNYIDAAVLNCRRSDGPYAPGTDTVKPEQFGIGKINPEPYLTPKLGDDAVKVGRTTGVTTGKLVEMNSATAVDYGAEGTGQYDKQYVFRSASGQFSAAGDSGSLILHAATLRPMALLFAGGGRDTIANPIGFVLDHFKAAFFKG
jgi:hypothetical protein